MEASFKENSKSDKELVDQIVVLFIKLKETKQGRYILIMQNVLLFVVHSIKTWILDFKVNLTVKEVII